MGWPARDPDEIAEVRTVNFANGGFVMLASSPLFEMTERDRDFVLDLLHMIEDYERGLVQEIEDDTARIKAEQHDDGGVVGHAAKDQWATDGQTDTSPIPDSQFESGPSSPKPHRCVAEDCPATFSSEAGAATHFRSAHVVYKCARCGQDILGAANKRYHRCPIEPVDVVWERSPGYPDLPLVEAAPDPPQAAQEAQQAEEQPEPALPAEDLKPGRFWSAVAKQDRTRVCACGGEVGWDRQGGICTTCKKHYHLWTLDSPKDGKVLHACPCGSTKTTDDELRQFGPRANANWTLTKDPLGPRR